jgi:formylglycine-generating enzyme required for sulfatase activity
LEQELDTIRRTLREKERVVEELAGQCRRLEDELEDQHLANEGLSQDLDRKQLSQVRARDQVDRLTRERQEIQERYRTLPPSRRLNKKFGGSRAGGPGYGKAAAGTRFIWGWVAGVLLAAVALGVWVRLGSLSPTDVHSPEESGAAPSSLSSTTPPAGSRPVRSSDSEAIPRGEPDRRVEVRDRLSDGSAGPSMLKIEGGDFTMGRRLALPDEDDGPVHKVHVQDFLIGATEVTYDEYDRFVRATGRRSPRDFAWGRGKRPVVDVSWEDARAYAQWLSRRTGRRYRLPTESEWEYAAAAGKDTFFWWGVEPGRGQAVCYDCGTRWDNRSSAPVGTFQPNPFGLYDTAGNVMEWVEDCYHPDYVGAPVDGGAWEEEGCRLRVARGGAFNKPARSMRATSRHGFAPETRLNALGFRVARDE